MVWVFEIAIFEVSWNHSGNSIVLQYILDFLIACGRNLSTDTVLNHFWNSNASEQSASNTRGCLYE